MKKVLALVLVAVLSLGMMVTSFAANSSTVDLDAALGLSDVKGATTDSGSEEDLDLRADAALYLSIPGATAATTEAQLKKDKITIQRTISSGSNIIRDIDFVTEGKGTGKYVAVRIRFVEEFVSTKDVDFSMTVYLAQKGKRQDKTAIELTGTFGNDVETVEEDRDYVDLSDKIVAEADGYNSKIEVYGGNGVSLMTKMMDGKKYYFTVDMDVDSSDEKVLNKYPDVVVYNLNMVGFSTGAKMVKFDLDGDKYYVYNEKGEAVGTTADLLTFSKKFYLSEKKLDMSGIAEVEESDDVDASEAPAESSVANNNNNPNTGVNGFANIAVVAGVVALAAAGAVAFKK